MSTPGRPDIGKVANGRVRKGWPLIRWPPGTTRLSIRKAHSDAKGLVNPGLQCYRNAVLQCLLHVPEFFRYFDREARCRSPGDGCVFCSLRGLARQYWTSTNHRLLQRAVARLNTAMESHSSRNPDDGQRYGFLRPDEDSENDMDSAGQQNAHEYLVGILNMLNYTSNDPINGVDILFNVEMKRSWTCRDCGKRHATRQGEQGINLRLDAHYQGKSLYDYLAAHFDDEHLDDAGCDSDVCNKRKRNRLRRQTIVRGPEILVIQLLRMEFNMHTLQERKIRDRVAYDERLDLSQWSNGPLRYQLHGIVAHQGASLHQGHYVAMVRCQNGADFAFCNDEAINSRPQRRAQILSKAESKTFQSYLLDYQKIGGKMAESI